MVLVQNWLFLHVFILGNMGQENVFYDIPEGKNAFQAIKTRSLKSQKIEIFLKGLVHGLLNNLIYCPLCGIAVDC